MSTDPVETKESVLSQYGLSVLQRPVIRTGFLSVCILLMFLAGYGLTARVFVVAPSQAQTSPILPSTFLGTDGYTPNTVPDGPGNSFCPFAPPFTWGSPCDNILFIVGYTEAINAFMRDTLLTNAIHSITRWIGFRLVDGMVLVIHTSIQHTERNLIDWWNTFWYYNFFPAMQDMAEQMGVSAADQVRAMQVMADTQLANKIKRTRAEAEAGSGQSGGIR